MERIVRSNISSGGIHRWRFEVFADEIVTISAGPSPNLDIAFKLTDPNGAVLSITDANPTGQSETVNQMTLITAGMYEIEVSPAGGTSGTYSLVVTDTTSEAYLVFKINLSYGGIGTGSLPEITDHLWDFAGSEGDMVTIRTTPTSANDLVLFLIAPDSTELIFVDNGDQGSPEEILNYLLPETGTYSIRVGELTFQPANYTLTLEGG
jgi:hypothetical protein